MIKMKGLLLTGGTGFVGRSLLRYWLDLAQRGAQVPDITVLTRAPTAFLTAYPEFDHLPWLAFHQGDILEPTSLPWQRPFSHVLHAAADSTLGPALTPLQRYQQIVDGTANVLNLAVECGARRLLLTSSGGVYGNQPAQLASLPENYHGMADPLVPANAYSVAKRCAEHLCALYYQNHGLETVIARCFAFVGPDLPLDAHFAIGNFIRDALWSELITVHGDGSPIRSYMYQSDLAHWLNVLLEYGVAGEAYNVGSDEAVSIKDLAELVRSLIAPEKAVVISGNQQADNNRRRYIPDITKSRVNLQLNIEVSLKAAIENTANAVKIFHNLV